MAILLSRILLSPLSFLLIFLPLFFFFLLFVLRTFFSIYALSFVSSLFTHFLIISRGRLVTGHFLWLFFLRDVHQNKLRPSVSTASFSRRNSAPPFARCIRYIYDIEEGVVWWGGANKFLGILSARHGLFWIIMWILRLAYK